MLVKRGGDRAPGICMKENEEMLQEFQPDVGLFIIKVMM